MFQKVDDLSSLLYEMEYDPESMTLNQLVREFSHQISHQPICFTAAAFFIINYSSLASVRF